MPLSSGSIIHFTKEKESLFEILRENFRVFYCAEDYKFGVYHFTGKVPMVSFCDIPLSEVKRHIGSYGCYGIGLTKEWAIRKGLNPVFYIESGSSLAKSLAVTFKEYVVKHAEDKPSRSQVALMDLLRYVKNYEADLTRKTETIPKYRFSDEREWRYAPRHSPDHEMMLSMAEYEEDPVRHDASIEKLRLTFRPNDIKYILIKDDSEINEFVRHLTYVKGKRYTHDEIERLTTRLMTSEQIMTDV